MVSGAPLTRSSPPSIDTLRRPTRHVSTSSTSSPPEPGATSSTTSEYRFGSSALQSAGASRVAPPRARAGQPRSDISPCASSSSRAWCGSASSAPGAGRPTADSLATSTSSASVGGARVAAHASLQAGSGASRSCWRPRRKGPWSEARTASPLSEKAFAAAAVSVAAASTIEPASATSSEKSAVAPEGGTVVETAKSRMARRAGFEYRKQCRWMPDSHHWSWSSRYEPSEYRTTWTERMCSDADIPSAETSLVTSNSAGSRESCE
mmetsp:Transcript_32765/g.97762  ORF Transcript_32765/g.97762 Transcript_32765/m.97762 type:complete len:265 (+) Transcript_32765:310-1104(+)